MKRAWLVSTLCMVFAVFLPLTVLAAPYGTGIYGNCPYQADCPVPPPDDDPPDDPVITPAPDEDDDTNTVTFDPDQDGNGETATDADGDPSNGFEQYNDPDGSSDDLVTIPDPDTGASTFIIDTDGDEEPDVYWDPSNNHSSDVQVITDDIGIGWVYGDHTGQSRIYYIRRFGNAPRPTPAANTQPPEERRLTTTTFGGAAYKSLGKLVQKIPKPVAYSFPYLLLLLIGVLITRLVMQAKRELSRLQVVLTTIEREKQLLFEKQNFLMLSSHYLRTPVTIIKGNIELLQSIKTISMEAAASLNASVKSILDQSNDILTKLEQNEGLARISNPDSQGHAQLKSFTSPFVIGPIAVIILLMILSQILFIDFRVTSPNILDYLVQIALVVLLVQLFVGKFRSRQITRKNRLDQERVLEEQRSLDTARSGLIQDASASLSKEVAALGSELDAMSANRIDVSKIRKGFVQLQGVTNKFIFATKLESQAIVSNKQQFSTKAMLDNIKSRLQQKASEKRVVISDSGQDLLLVQNQAMVNIVAESLMDNAVKYSNENSTVSVNTQAEEQQYRLSVQDTGKGISKQQLAGLFKPFSRAESAETFNTEGLGFSLYLDRLIMHYLGGDVQVFSEEGKGTSVEMTLPLL